MSPERTDLRVDGLVAEIGEGVRALGEMLIELLGGNLESITVVGSSVTADFQAGKSDINTVVVLGERTFSALESIASLGRAMKKRRVSAPLLMTRSYIERSRDVFGVEFLDFQLSHKTVLGEDPFSGLVFEKGDVRLQCERELKASLVRLRQGYISAAGNRSLVGDVLVSTAKGLMPLLRAMLWLKDVERPDASEATLRKSAEIFRISPTALDMLIGWRNKKIRPNKAEVEHYFEGVYATVERLAITVDELEV